MLTAKEFRKSSERVFLNDIIPILPPFEKERKATFQKLKKLWIIFIIAYAIYFYFALKFLLLLETVPDNLCLAVLFTPVIIIGLHTYSTCKNFEKKLKSETIPILLKKLNNFEWTDLSNITIEEVKATELFKKIKDKDDDDVFIGSYKDVGIEICEAVLRNDSPEEARFIFIMLSTDRNFKAKTRVYQKKLFRHFSPKKPPKNTRVYLEDVEFMKKYEVYSTDQIEARCLFTTAFIERFKQLSFAFKALCTDACIYENKIIFAINCQGDAFRFGSVSRSVYNLNEFRVMVNEIASILEIIDELKLNVNIGL